MKYSEQTLNESLVPMKIGTAVPGVTEYDPQYFNDPEDINSIKPEYVVIDGKVGRADLLTNRNTARERLSMIKRVGSALRGTNDPSLYSYFLNRIEPEKWEDFKGLSNKQIVTRAKKIMAGDYESPSTETTTTPKNTTSRMDSTTPGKIPADMNAGIGGKKPGAEKKSKRTSGEKAVEDWFNSQTRERKQKISQAMKANNMTMAQVKEYLGE